MNSRYITKTEESLANGGDVASVQNREFSSAPAIAQCLEVERSIDLVTCSAVFLHYVVGGLHCATGVHCKLPRKSFRTKVMDPLTTNGLAPNRSIFPPETKVTDPDHVKNVTISPGPNEL
jgi:hypothetical protein